MHRERPIAIRELGHVSFFVRDLDACRHFYTDVLGLRETGTGKHGRIVFFSAGRHHHDVSCELAPAPADGVTPPHPNAGPRPMKTPGFYHVAFLVGDSLDDLSTARRWVEQHDIAAFGETPTSFSVNDPDGHMVELYVELR